MTWHFAGVAEHAVRGGSGINRAFAIRSSPGVVRDINEDRAVAVELAVAPGRPSGVALVVAVADGMGGHAAGEVASHAAVNEVVQAVQLAAVSGAEAAFSPIGAIEAAFGRANATVYEMGMSSVEARGMGTTLTVAIVYGSQVCVGHVGDSRAYLVRDGAVRRITRDHSVVQQKVDAGIITAEEAAISEERNQLIRVVGTHPSVISDVVCEEVRGGDVLVLCTDGLYSSVTEPDIVATVGSASTPQDACDALVALAEERDGSDNITAACVGVGPEAFSARQMAAGDPHKHVPRSLIALVLVVVLALVAVVVSQLVYQYRAPTGAVPVVGPSAIDGKQTHSRQQGASAPDQHALKVVHRTRSVARKRQRRSSVGAAAREPLRPEAPSPPTDKHDQPVAVPSTAVEEAPAASLELPAADAQTEVMVPEKPETPTEGRAATGQTKDNPDEGAADTSR